MQVKTAERLLFVEWGIVAASVAAISVKSGNGFPEPGTLWDAMWIFLLLVPVAAVNPQLGALLGGGLTVAELLRLSPLIFGPAASPAASPAVGTAGGGAGIAPNPA